MSDLLTCPECSSENVTATYEQKFRVNTADHYCPSVKIQDPDAKADCLDCSWQGQRQELKEQP